MKKVIEHTLGFTWVLMLVLALQIAARVIFQY